MEEQFSELEATLKFIENIDALKQTYRKCLIMSAEREESTAEHSFSLAMAVLCFCQFSNKPVDVMKTVKMALFHDLAEALLGDTFHYEKGSKVETMAEEDALREVLKPLLATNLHDEILSLWKEFEFGNSSEAVFLRGLDRFLPMYHNFKTEGHSWVKYGVSKEQALSKNAHIEQSSRLLWSFTQRMVESSQEKGWLR